jgi:hypothetical protein
MKKAVIRSTCIYVYVFNNHIILLCSQLKIIQNENSYHMSVLNFENIEFHMMLKQTKKFENFNYISFTSINVYSKNLYRRKEINFELIWLINIKRDKIKSIYI